MRTLDKTFCVQEGYILLWVVRCILRCDFSCALSLKLVERGAAVMGHQDSNSSMSLFCTSAMLGDCGRSPVVTAMALTPALWTRRNM